MSDIVTNTNGVVVINNTGGHTVISRVSPLKRLHYFDGKFLRAVDLNLEQQALLNQVRLSNQASGSGVVHGYSCMLATGDRLEIGPGLAIDPGGRVLHLAEEIQIGVAALIEKSRQSLSDFRKAGTEADAASIFGECELAAEEAPETILEGVRLYLITVGHAEAYCGEEDVYGKLCEEACITSTERPYVIEGVVIRALPLDLTVALAGPQAIVFASKHLRSRVASAYFADERRITASLISSEGLNSSLWCLGAEAKGGTAVPLAVLARAGSKTIFLDTWIARREGMETPPRRYWARRMAMRPWNVFLAQVLQFQCQLAQCYKDKFDKLPSADPCEEERKVIVKAAKAIKLMGQKVDFVMNSMNNALIAGSGIPADSEISISEWTSLQDELAAIEATRVSNRYLIDCGIVELPSAGYLLVNSADTMTVNEQVRRLMGEGVDLRFCVVRPDYIPHALEEAQHMERISLLQGLKNSENKPHVDILVPDGRIEELHTVAPGRGYEMSLTLSEDAVKLLVSLALRDSKGDLDFINQVVGAIDLPSFTNLYGAARADHSTNGEYIFLFAGTNHQEGAKIASYLNPRDGNYDMVLEKPPAQTSVWARMSTESDPFTLAARQNTTMSWELAFLIVDGERKIVVRLIYNGDFLVEETPKRGEDESSVIGHLSGNVLIKSNVDETIVGNEPPASPSISINEKVGISRCHQNGSPDLYKIEMSQPTFFPSEFGKAIRVKRQWTGHQDAEVQGQLAVSRGKVGENNNSLFVADQHEDAAVLAPGHEAHESSTIALNVLGNALKDLGDPHFRSRAEQQLFPTPQLVPSDMQVYSRHDWVMFHRRRDRQCAYDDIPPSPTVARRYRVYHVVLPDADSVDTLNEALETNESNMLQKFNLQRTSLVVEFGPGISAVISSYQALRSDWQSRFNETAEIYYGAIASQGPVVDEGHALAVARLDSFTDILDPVTDVIEGADLVRLSGIPAVFEASGVDGVMVIATISVATICHQLYRLAISAEDLNSFLEKINPSDSVHKVLTDNDAKDLSTRPLFESGSTSFVDQNTAGLLKNEWSGFDNGRVKGVLTVAQEPLPNSLPEQPLNFQVKAVTDALQLPEEVEILHMRTIAQVLKPCPIITVLLVEPEPEIQCNEVFYLRTEKRTYGDTIEILKHIENDVLSEDFLEKIPLINLGIVEFEKDEFEAINSSLVNVQEKWTRILHDLYAELANDNADIFNKKYNMLLAPVSSENNDAIISSNKERTKSIGKGLDVSGVGSIQTEGIVSDLRIDDSKECGAMTFIFIVEQ